MKLSEILQATGLTPLSCMSNLTIHRQCESRIKLLEDILQYHMRDITLSDDTLCQYGTPLSHESSNGSCSPFEAVYSMLSKLTTELDDLYLVLKQLDINNTIDHRPDGDAAWYFLNDVPVYKYWRKLLANRPIRDIYSDYAYPKPVGFKDECSKMLEAATMKSRRGFTIQRLINAMTQAHRMGWFVVFDTLTISDDMARTFYSTPNALRDYFRDVGREILSAENRSVKESTSDCYQYFCVPEFGTKEGRLHFHVIHLVRTLPSGSFDPNYGRSVRNRRQIESFRGLWPYGFTQPIAVRYSQDAFTRLGWLWPVDAKGIPLKSTSYMSVAFYVAKYVNKKHDVDKSLKFEGKSWNISLRSLLSTIPTKVFRTRMSRNFGMKLPSMSALSTQSLIQMMRLSYDSTPLNKVLAQNAKKEMRLRLAGLPVSVVLESMPPTTSQKSKKYAKDRKKRSRRKAKA